MWRDTRVFAPKSEIGVEGGGVGEATGGLQGLGEGYRHSLPSTNDHSNTKTEAEIKDEKQRIVSEVRS